MNKIHKFLIAHSIIIIILLIIVIIILSFYLAYNLRTFVKHWKTSTIPPSIKDKIVVYLSGPEFCLADNIFAVGINGMGLDNIQVSLQDSLCNLNDQNKEMVRECNRILELPEYGIVQLIAQKGWSCYCPARDGLDPLPRYLNAINAETGKSISSTEAQQLTYYLSKAIYANDIYGMCSFCNTCIFNSNGLQIDDGAAAEIGVVGTRGMPTVYYRGQVTDQFGPFADNPMPLGNASSIMTQRSFTVQQAITLLDNKITNLLNNNDWWSLEYDNTTPPPPLIQFWTEIGEAVFLTRFKKKEIIMDPNTGLVDQKNSYTDFYYKNWFTIGSSQSITLLAQKIRDNMQTVEKRWEKIIPVWAGCKNPSKVTLDEIYNNSQLCNLDGTN